MLLRGQWIISKNTYYGLCLACDGCSRLYAPIGNIDVMMSPQQYCHLCGLFKSSQWYELYDPPYGVWER